MGTENKIHQIINDAVIEINSQLPQDKQLDKSKDTPLFGENANIDSLGFVNLLVNIEYNIEDEFNISITIANEQAMSQKNSPFKTIGTLTEYVTELVQAAKDG